MGKIMALGALVAAIFAPSACKPHHDSSAAELKGNVALQEAPPKVLYHYGIYRYLRPYDKRGSGFSATEWSSIPSNTPKFGGKSRAGLYLSQHPAYNEAYAYHVVTAKTQDSPWMLTVTLADSCRTSRRWIDFSARPDMKHCSAASFVRGEAIPENCDDEALGWIKDKGIGVVRDSWWAGRGFWYVVDPACVESLDATPEGFLRAAADVPEFWGRAPFENDQPRDQGWGAYPYTPGEVGFAVLVRVLNDARTVNETQLEKIAANARASDLIEMKADLVALTNAAVACAKARRFPDLKQQLASFLAKFEDGRFAAEKLTFAQHAGNLTRFGLSKLNSVCPPERGHGTVRRAEGPEPSEAKSARVPITQIKGRFATPNGSYIEFLGNNQYTFRHHQVNFLFRTDNGTMRASLIDQWTVQFNHVSNGMWQRITVVDGDQLSLTDAGAPNYPVPLSRQ